MKKCIFAIIALLMTFHLSAQENKRESKYPLPGLLQLQGEAYANRDKPWKERTPDHLMQQASIDFLWSAGLVIPTAGFTIAGASVNKKRDRNVLFTLGGISGVACLTMFFKGAIGIGSAGKVMEKERYHAYLKPSTEGIGLNLSF